MANFKKSLKALEVKVAEDSGILTEAQVQALETLIHLNKAANWSKI